MRVGAVSLVIIASLLEVPRLARRTAFVGTVVAARIFHPL